LPESTPKHRWIAQAGPSLAGLVLLVACIGPLRSQWAAGSWPGERAADAKPLFLGARAVRLGADPLDAGVLETLAKQSGMREGGGAGAVRSADPRRGSDKGGAWRSMYPVTASLLLQVLRPERWATFVVEFRALGWALLLAGAGAAGAAGAGRRRWILPGMGLGWMAILSAAPPVSEALGVAQANVHIAGLTGLALGLMALGQSVAVGLVVAAGAGIKLLPLGLVAPVAAGRRWSAVVAATAGLGVLVALASTHAAVDVQLADMVESVRYQAAVAPKWVLRDAPRPAFVLYHLRQGALGAVTGVLSLLLLWPQADTGEPPWRQRIWTALRRPAPAADVTTAAAVVAAWMAVLGAGSQRIYAVLQVPVWAWLLGSVLAPGLRWPGRGGAAVLAALVVVPAQLDATGISGWDGRAVVLLGAWLAWTAVALRCLLHGWSDWGWLRRGAALASLGWLAGTGLWWAGPSSGG